MSNLPLFVGVVGVIIGLFGFTGRTRPSDSGGLLMAVFLVAMLFLAATPGKLSSGTECQGPFGNKITLGPAAQVSSAQYAADKAKCDRQSRNAAILVLLIVVIGGGIFLWIWRLTKPEQR